VDPVGADPVRLREKVRGVDPVRFRERKRILTSASLPAHLGFGRLERAVTRRSTPIGRCPASGGHLPYLRFAIEREKAGPYRPWSAFVFFESVQRESASLPAHHGAAEP
jgi:hypothetical protein